MGLFDLVLKSILRPRATVGYPDAPADSVHTTRVPRFDQDRCDDERACAAACPTAALTVGAEDGVPTWALDYGRCIFCAECIRACPSGAIVGTGDFELAAKTRTAVVARHVIREERP